MKIEKKKTVLFFVAFTVLCLTGCNGHQDSRNIGVVEKKQMNLSAVETKNPDAILLTKFNYQIEGGDIEKARVHASQLSAPEGRVVAFLKILVKGKETPDTSACKKEVLNEAIQNLNSITNLEVKFALQQEFLSALLKLDPNHQQKTLTETYLSVLDNFWETSSTLDTNMGALSFQAVSMINESLNKLWNLEASNLKKCGLEGKIHTAKLRYPLNPAKARTEINNIKDQVWEINPPSNRTPFLLDLIEFEIDVTKDILEARRLITTLKKALDMENNL